MKINHCFFYLILFQVSLFISCSKNNDQIKAIDLKKTIEIAKGDLLIVNLGSFGDEEGATILTAPENAKESSIQRQVNTGVIQYRYLPLDNFVGKDSVTLVLYRGSDGASRGECDTTTILILVR